VSPNPLAAAAILTCLVLVCWSIIMDSYTDLFEMEEDFYVDDEAP
jgi:hypothetical protein